MTATLLFLRQHWKLAIVGGMILLLIVQTFRLQNAASELEAERLGRASDRSEYQRAQAQATASALSEKMKKEAEYAAKADDADTRYADLSGQYRATVLRYQAAQRAASGNDLPESAGTAEGSDRSGGGAVVSVGDILIPQADALICAENTARLQAAHEWVTGLTH
jgi:hypothetical protein